MAVDLVLCAQAIRFFIVFTVPDYQDQLDTYLCTHAKSLSKHVTMEYVI